MTAPVTVIIGHDMAFYDKLPQLFPHADARSWFAGNQPLIETAAVLGHNYPQSNWYKQAYDLLGKQG